MLAFKIALKSINIRKQILPLGALAIGVASLIVSMAVVSGYETSLKKSVIEAVGHVLLYKKDSGSFTKEEIEKNIFDIGYKVKGSTPFYVLEGLLAKNKKIKGVIVEGVDPASVHTVLKIKKKIIKGKFDLDSSGKYPKALVGQIIAKDFGLKIGDKFPLVIPQSEFGSMSLKPKLKMLQVAGITSMGRHDYDSRYIITDIKMTQEFAATQAQVTGWRLKLDSDDAAIDFSKEINSNYLSYSARNWWDINANLFEAIKYEKPIIFIVIFVIVLAAAFNIASSLFISVMRETKDIATLKAIGMSEKVLLRLYVFKGVIIGLLGSLAGLILGFIFCVLITELNNRFGLLPSKVYKITSLQLELRMLDILSVLGTTMLICFFAVLMPAYQASRKPITEGLRYE